MTPFLPGPIKRYLREWVRQSALPMWRIRPGVTRLLGTEYKPNHECIEIDITYACNLGCHSCNRSVSQAPADQMSLDQIRRFIQDSIQNNRK